jgi:hypothetical protein
VHQNYKLIITGYSFGGGISNILNILLHKDHGFRIDGRTIHCFSYTSSPPVFGPLDLVPEAAKSRVNYIHEMDNVSFLLGYYFHHLFNTIEVLEENTCKVSATRFDPS